MAVLVAQRQAASQLRLAGLLGRPLAEQAAALLSDEAQDGAVALSQQILAAMLGVRRPSLNKILKDFERRGLIELGYRAITIHDPAGLTRQAGIHHLTPAQQQGDRNATHSLVSRNRRRGSNHSDRALPRPGHRRSPPRSGKWTSLPATRCPTTVDIAAPREVVFDILATPYLGRQTHAMADKIHILERGSDMVLAAHRTPISRRLAATTVETVRFTRPERVDFRLVRGPVPEVTEQFLLTGDHHTTHLEYRGRLATDLWQLGTWWGQLVATRWQHVVADTLTNVQAAAERRTHHH